MIAVVHSSVLLRQLFGEKNPFAEWRRVDEAYASRLVEVLASLDVVAISDSILSRAAAPMPTTLGTLDAIHLATAMAVAEARNSAVVLLTHDEQLARAAVASGLEVAGISRRP